MKERKLILLVTVLICLQSIHVFPQKKKQGSMITEHLLSTILRGTRTGLDSNRVVKIYLPPGYATTGNPFPVVYYLHSVFSSAEQALADGRIVNLLERGFASGTVGEFIFVVADFSSPTTGSIYENAPATGRWLDFIAKELVSFIDNRFHTIRHRESRAFAGEMMGGRGVFEMALLYPELFSVAYAMNPVATGLGLLPIQAYPNWKKIHQAKSFEDLKGERVSQIFVTVSQAYLPNPNRPPFYCDFLMEMSDGQFRLRPENTQKLKEGFLIDHHLDKYWANLRKMRGIAFDWSRYDPIQDHVYASEALSRKLDSFGIEHEAEEYRGVYWEENWADYGRFYSRVLPFLNRHLLFE